MMNADGGHSGQKGAECHVSIDLTHHSQIGSCKQALKNLDGFITCMYVLYM